MLTLVVLTTGLVVILKSFVISLDQMNHLTNRLYATVLLENKISSIERKLRAEKTLPFELNPVDTISIGRKNLEIEQAINIGSVEDFVDVFKLDVRVSWKEGARDLHLTRSAYLSDFR